jgi:putative membrane protein
MKRGDIMSVGIAIWTSVSLLVGTTIGRGEDRKPVEKPFDDAQFVKLVASEGIAEVQLGKIASQKARSAEVKKFGEKMIAEHSKVGEELKKTAKHAGLAVPEQMEPEQHRHVDRFKVFKGEEFDCEYMKHMVKDHESAVALFTRAGKEAKNLALKDFATKSLPAMQGHLEEAKKLQKE